MKVKLFRLRLAEDFIRSDQDALNKFLEDVTVRRTATELIESPPKYWSVMLFYEDTFEKIRTTKKSRNVVEQAEQLPEKTLPEAVRNAKEKVETSSEIHSEESTLSPEEFSRLEALKQWRNETAVRLNLPGYMVTSNATLTNITRFNPQTVEALIEIKGLGPNKVEKFGNDIIALLNAL